MNNDISNKGDLNQSTSKQEIDWFKLAKKIWSSRALILKLCAIGAITGIVIITGTPKLYTAGTLVAHEGTRSRSFSDISTLVGMSGDMNSSIATERDALYPSLYLAIVQSTPFLLRLSDIKVHKQKDSTTITLAQYLKEHQKSPWWSAITSAPSTLIGGCISLFREKTEMGNRVENTKSTPLRLTREEAGITRAIASCISIEIDKKKRTIAIKATMQDPQVAATLADTVQARLKAYMTAYRTVKARNILKYNENLCEKAQAEYHSAQVKYTQYADANRNLTMMIPRARLSRLQSDMDLALSAYNQRKKQVEAAQARVEKETPVYTVIQPVVLPLSPSSPRKMLILAGCIFLTAAGSVGWVLYVKDFFQKIRKNGIAFRQSILNTKKQDYETRLFNSRTSHPDRG